MLKVKATQRVKDPIVKLENEVKEIIAKVVSNRKQQFVKRTYGVSDYRLSMILLSKTLKTSELNGLLDYEKSTLSAPTHDEGEE